jgi:hypothetical protein
MPRAKQLPGAQIVGDAVIYKRYVELKQVASHTAKYFNKGQNNVYPSRKQVDAAVKRHLDGTSASYWTNAHRKPGGRPPILDNIAKDNLKGQARQSMIRRDFIRPTPELCAIDIEKERKKMLVRLGFETREDLINMLDPKYSVSQKTVDKLIDEIWPKKEKSSYIAERREEVKREIRNNISCAAVAGFTFSHTNPACCATSDHFAVRRNANGEIQVIRVADGSQQLMKEQGLSAGHGVSSQGASVTMPIHATMTKALQMVALVGEVWDDQLLKHDGEPVKIYALDATNPEDMLTAVCFSAVIAHGTPHELVMHKIYKDILIPKMVRIRDAAKALRSTQGAVQIKSVSVAASASSGNKRGRDANLSQSRSIRTRDTSPTSTQGQPVLLPSSPPAASSSRINRELESLAGGNDLTSNLRLSANSRAAAQTANPAAMQDADEDEEDDSGDCAQTGAGPWFGHPDEWDIVFCLDGDSAPLAAIMDHDKMLKWGKLSLDRIIDRNFGKWGAIKFLKWAAACTPMQSPNDGGKTHMIGALFIHLHLFLLMTSCRKKTYQRRCEKTHKSAAFRGMQSMPTRLSFKAF